MVEPASQRGIYRYRPGDPGSRSGVRLLTRARVDKTQAAIVAALRAYGCSVTHLHGVKDGCPDILIGIHGRMGLAEIKTPQAARSRNSGRTEHQIKWWSEWRGPAPEIVFDIDGALRFARTLAWGT